MTGPRISGFDSFRLPKEAIIDTRKAIDAKAMGLMICLCMTWGLQQVVLKAAAQDIAPLLLIALRSGVAAILVGLLMLFRGERMSLGDGTWRPGLLVGFLFALEFLFVGEGLRYTSASHTVVFLYTAPVFAAIGLHWKLKVERLQPFQWLGILLAFTGIVIAFFFTESATNERISIKLLVGRLPCSPRRDCMGCDNRSDTLLKSLQSFSHPNIALSVGRCIHPADVGGYRVGSDRLPPNPSRLGKPFVPVTGGILCKLSDLVLAAAQLFGFPARRFLVHDATLRYSFRGVAVT